MVVLIPLATFAVTAVDQAGALANTIETTIETKPEQFALAQNFIERFIPFQDLQSLIKVAAQAAFEFIKTAAVPLASSAISLVINFIFFVLLLVIFLVQKDVLVTASIEALPFHRADAKKIVESIVATIGPIMRSTIIVAAIQAVLGIFILALFGTPSLVFFFFALFFASFIPLGSGLVIVPIGIIYLLLGNIVAGVSIILWHTFITSSSDNIIRSWLFSGGNTKLPELLTLLATLGGLSVFGILGIIFGPLLAVVFIVFYRLYLEKKQRWANE